MNLRMLSLLVLPAEGRLSQSKKRLFGSIDLAASPDRGVDLRNAGYGRGQVGDAVTCNFPCPRLFVAKQSPHGCLGKQSTMRILGIVALSAALMGCAASRQEVAARLGADYVGQNIDALVVKFGPPTSMFKMNSGQTSYQWQLSNVTDVAVDRGYGQASTQYCKVGVIASPAGIVTQLNTEDSNAGNDLYAAFGAYGSICAHRLGMKPQT
jgi:hypothetical protein